MYTDKNELNFVLASDENYADKLAVSMYSIFETHRDFKRISIHVLSNNINSASIENLNLIAKKFENSNLIIYDLNNLGDLLGKEVNVDHLSLAAYARLFIAEFLPNEIKKALYLDVDILVNVSLIDLFSINISNYFVAGVKSLLDLSETEIHINSGVTLWNLQKCREEDFIGKCLQLIRESNGKFKFHDQTIINTVCNKKMLVIDPKYNVMSGMFFLEYSKFLAVYGLRKYYSEEEFQYAVSNPSIIHLTSWVTGRPWERECVHPFKEKYRTIIRTTPWANTPLKENPNELSNRFKRFLYKTLSGWMINNLTMYKRKIKKVVRSK